MFTSKKPKILGFLLYGSNLCLKFIKTEACFGETDPLSSSWFTMLLVIGKTLMPWLSTLKIKAAQYSTP